MGVWLYSRFRVRTGPSFGCPSPWLGSADMSAEEWNRAASTEIPPSSLFFFLTSLIVPLPFGGSRLCLVLSGVVWRALVQVLQWRLARARESWRSLLLYEDEEDEGLPEALRGGRKDGAQDKARTAHTHLMTQ